MKKAVRHVTGSTAKKRLQGGVGVLMALAGACHAGAPDEANMSTKTVDLNFGTTSTFLHELTAGSALFAPEMAGKETLAGGRVATSGPDAVLAIRLSQNAPGQAVPRVLHAMVQGKGGPDNVLKINLDTPHDSACTYENKPDGWCISKVARQSLSYNLFADGAQTVAVDTYTASMDGAIWQP